MDNIERNQANVEGTKFENLFLMFACVCFAFFVCVWVDLVDLTPVKRVYEKSFEMCICL